MTFQKYIIPKEYYQNILKDSFYYKYSKRLEFEITLE